MMTACIDVCSMTPVTPTLRGRSGRLPSLLIDILSFVFVGIYWNNHHRLLRATKRIGSSVMWSNLHLLFWLLLIPFATGWVRNAHRRALPGAAYEASPNCTTRQRGFVTSPQYAATARRQPAPPPVMVSAPLTGETKENRGFISSRKIALDVPLGAH